jgi:Tat protein secretion system quality control protein TatD with DNase activity
MYLPHIAAAVAEARGEPVESLAQASTEAARKLFRIPRIDAKNIS